MVVTNTQSGTNVHEIASGRFRISTPVVIEGAGGFTFNQYLIADDEPLLFHTGPRRMFPLVREAVRSVLPVESLRHIALSHVEADECGSLNEWLAAAPRSAPLCGTVAALVSIADLADRPPRALADGERLRLGQHSVRWFDAPHLPHSWECGFLTEELTSTMLCGDLFTQGGADLPPVTEADILGPSEAFRHEMDYFSPTKNARALLERLASTQPALLACMHGSAWRGARRALVAGLLAMPSWLFGCSSLPSTGQAIVSGSYVFERAKYSGDSPLDGIPLLPLAEISDSTPVHLTLDGSEQLRVEYTNRYGAARVQCDTTGTGPAHWNAWRLVCEDTRSPRGVPIFPGFARESLTTVLYRDLEGKLIVEWSDREWGLVLFIVPFTDAYDGKAVLSPCITPTGSTAGPG